MAERVASIGYAAIKKQTAAGTAVTPNVYTPYYKQSMVTDIHLIEDNPIVGNKFKGYQALQGMRSHNGSITVMAEPNTAAYWLDMLLTRSSTTGSGPYTHVFGLSTTTDPNFYTLDLSLGSQVVRFWGIGASKITPIFQDGEMQFEIDLSGLGSFYGREIASVSGTTVTLKTDYDPSPTTGLVASDLIKLTTVDGATSTNFTVSSITNGTTLEVSASAAAFAAGDMLLLRPATPSYTLKTPFLWQRTEFRFGAAASAALSATQTRLEEGTEVVLMHDFEDSDGAKRSGAFDPAALVRTLGDASFKVKKYFDLPAEIKEWNAIIKKACVIRSFSEGSTYELRITLNNLRQMSNDTQTEAGEVIYQETEYATLHDTSDGQGMSVTVLNNVSSI